jgi:hypothetical protein
MQWYRNARELRDEIAFCLDDEGPYTMVAHVLAGHADQQAESVHSYPTAALETACDFGVA